MHNVYYCYVYKTKGVTIYYVDIHEKIEHCLSGWENLRIKIMGRKTWIDKCDFNKSQSLYCIGILNATVLSRQINLQTFGRLCVV